MKPTGNEMTLNKAFLDLLFNRDFDQKIKININVQ